MSENIAEIREKLTLTLDIEEKVNLTNRLSELVRHANVEQSLDLCKDAIELAKSV